MGFQIRLARGTVVLDLAEDDAGALGEAEGPLANQLALVLHSAPVAEDTRLIHGRISQK